MRMCSIASGSSGNCIYVGSDDTHLLVDTGISKKRIEEGLKTLELKGEDLDGILITHEHSDHIQGLGVFSRNMRFRSMLRGNDHGDQKLFRFGENAGRTISRDPCG